MLWSTLPGILSRTLPNTVGGTLPACLTVCPQVSGQGALKHTPKNTIMYTPNCTWWHTPSLLGSTLPSILLCSKTLPNSVDHMLPPMLLWLDSETCWVVEVRYQEAWGWWWMVGSVWGALGSMCCVVCGKWQVVYIGQHNDVSQYGSLNCIFNTTSMTRSHNTPWAQCWQLEPFVETEWYSIGSRAELICNSDFSAESAASILSIVGICVCMHSGGDGDDGKGARAGDGDGDGVQST